MLKKMFKFFFKDRLVLLALIANILLNIAIWLNLLRIKPISGLIPLHYNIYFGVDYIGVWRQIFLLPLFGLGIIILNFFLGGIFFFKEKFISYTLIYSALLCQFIILLASFSLVWINT